MGTQLETKDGTVVAKRMAGGRERGTLVRMNVTQAEWAWMQHMTAEVEDGSFEGQTCADVVAAWEVAGATVVWLTPEEWNAMARECVNWPVLADMCRDRARQAMREQLRVVK